MRVRGAARASGDDRRPCRCRGHPGDPSAGSRRPARARRKLPRANSGWAGYTSSRVNNRASSLSFGHTSRHGRVARAGHAGATSVQKLLADLSRDWLGVVRAVPPTLAAPATLRHFAAFFRGLADGPRAITHKNKTRNVSVRSSHSYTFAKLQAQDSHGVTHTIVLSLPPF